jgi:hypothetical protein
MPSSLDVGLFSIYPHLLIPSRDKRDLSASTVYTCRLLKGFWADRREQNTKTNPVRLDQSLNTPVPYCD